MAERVLTPSKISAWLECAAYLDLMHQVEDGLREAPAPSMSSFALLLAEKGLAHEDACRQAYLDRGCRVKNIPERLRGESFATWVARIGDPFAGDDWDVLYQVPLVHGDIRGIADFVERREASDGSVTFEPVDAKLARKEAKPGHVLQLSFYAEAIDAATGARPEHLHLWLGSGTVETFRTVDFAAYWKRLRARLALVLDQDVVSGVAAPKPCDHCPFCEFAEVCDRTWRDADSLVFVAGLRRPDQALLEDASVGTLAALADSASAVVGLTDQRRNHLVSQADLQRKAREQPEEEAPPFLVIQADEESTPAGPEPAWGRGFALLPEPDEGDVFLDFEGHPFWRADAGLFFLMGLIERTAEGVWEYRTWWAHNEAEEGVAAGELIAYLEQRREQFPGMHVYHYNHTERSSLEGLATRHGVGEVALQGLIDTGAFVDLLVVARNAVQVGVESYGLKSLERLPGYERGHEIDKGAGAVIEYERWMRTGASDALTAIAAYNEDDVRATRAVRDWLVEQRPAGLDWRRAILDPEDELPELDACVEQLHTAGPGTPEHLLGDVLGYWRREWKAYLAGKLAACTGEPDDLQADPSVLVGLEPVGPIDRFGKNGKSLTPAMRFRFPPQESAGMQKSGKQNTVLIPVVDGPPAFAGIDRLDPEAGEIDLIWSAALTESGVVPSVVTAHSWTAPKPKPDALTEFADAVLDPTAIPNPAAMALLRRDLPRFLPGREPSGNRFTDDLDDMLAWTTAMDGTCVAVQGPPGTGKTYRGARQIHALITAGRRVGITAFSHNAIDNLLQAVVELFEERGDQALLRSVRKNTTGSGPLGSVTYTATNSPAAKPAFNLVAGTTWLFSGADMAAQPVDVLVVDEAGQLALADALAACRSTRNLLLLGDPLQLPQVAQASHPVGSGVSVLQHVLGDAATMPEERGVFLGETRRMHPDICTFISENIYEGRLTSHASCAKQTTEFGTGLRWLRAEHEGRSSHAVEEVELMHAEIRRLLGRTWTNQHGSAGTITVDDFLVLAPYNDQVNLLRERLDADPSTRGVAVGTVDKFQGREAAVVFFSMTTSHADHMPRAGDFLFSRNRLNVAISRARCLAYLVCTEELLNTRGRDVEEMRLISTLCAFAAAAEGT